MWIIRGDLLICVGCAGPLSIILSPVRAHERGSLRGQPRRDLRHGELGSLVQLLQLLELPLTLLPASLLVASLDLVVNDVGVVVGPLRRHGLGRQRTAISRVSRESLLLLVNFFTVIIIVLLGLCSAIDLLESLCHLELV